MGDLGITLHLGIWLVGQRRWRMCERLHWLLGLSLTLWGGLYGVHRHPLDIWRGCILGRDRI